MRGLGVHAGSVTRVVMREKLPVIATLAALGVALAFGFWMRATVHPPAAEQPQAPASESGRSARVEERLQMLRESYERQQQLEQALQVKAQAHGADVPPAGAGRAPSGLSADAVQRMQRGTHGGWRAERAGGDPTPAVQAPPPTVAAARPQRYRSLYHPAWSNRNTSVDDLEETILHGTQNEKRLEAVEELGLKEPEDAERVLTEALLDESLDPTVYVAVLQAVGDYSEDIPADALMPAIHHQNAQVRFEAVSVLGDMDTPAARAALKDATKDSDPEVRDLAVGVLEIIG